MRYAVAVACVFVFALASPAYGRLRQPGGDAGQQLTVNKNSARANPEVDAWHEEERARIEAECDEMMTKLRDQKRQKLQDIVDEAARRVEEERRRLAEAEGEAQKELDDLEKEKDALKAKQKAG